MICCNKNPAVGGFFVYGIVSNCFLVCSWIIILHIMQRLKYLLFFLCLLDVRNVYASFAGLQIGVGVSALSGTNVLVGYRYVDSDSWVRKFNARFDFADTGPLKSAIDSAIDHVMRDGIDVGDGVKIDDGKLDSSHYALLVDFYPFDSGWRLTGGYLWGNMKLDAAINGIVSNAPSQRFYFYINGDHYYYNGNQFNGNVAIDWDFYGPYLGTGFDIGLFCGFRFFMDFGIALTNRPARLDLNIPHEQLYIYDKETQTWSPVNIPQLDADVAAAESDANHELSDVRVYPVVKMGFVYRF